MFIHSTLLFSPSVLSATTVAQPGVPPAKITPTPTNFQGLSIRTTKKSLVTVLSKPTPYTSFCCAYNSIKTSNSVIETNYTLHFAGFGNTDSSPAHSGTYPSTDSLCAPGLDAANDAAFKNEAGYKMTITCLPSYGATNVTYVYLNMVVPTKNQGEALLLIVLSGS
ncbi:hypothetical protein EAF04_001079 [Stromatinia cepivora]|nr:hypothetical protein EAF04_001079 [Stromatinia cepivora]